MTVDPVDILDLDDPQTLYEDDFMEIITSGYGRVVLYDVRLYAGQTSPHHISRAMSFLPPGAIIRKVFQDPNSDDLYLSFWYEQTRGW